MRISKHLFQRGDTLIEVLFAVTVFSLVAVGSLSIMNQGTATAQSSLEITLVRQEIDAQAEALRFIHDSYIAAYPSVTTGPALEWPKVVAKSVVQASAYGICPTTLPSGAFVINAKTAKLETDSAKIRFEVPTYAQLRYGASSVLTQAEGIWVEAVQSAAVSGSQSGFIDFHIRACWESAGRAAPMTLGTIVRLYEPR